MRDLRKSYPVGKVTKEKGKRKFRFSKCQLHVLKRGNRNEPSLDDWNNMRRLFFRFRCSNAIQLNHTLGKPGRKGVMSSTSGK